MATASIMPAVNATVDSDALYEVLNGKIVERPPMGVLETLIASLIDRHLQSYVTARNLGWVVAEMLFDFTRALNKKRRPDLAFVSYDRWPKNQLAPGGDAWDVVPNLAIEVVSPTNPADEVIEKIADYFQVSADRVWVVYPSQRLVYIYSSPTDIKVIAERNELADEAMLPGFRISMADLFGITTRNQ